MSTNYFATCPRGAEPLLAEELRGLGAATVKDTVGGVHFSGGIEAAYRACLWSRTASRVLLPLTTFAVADADALYAGAGTVSWDELFAPTRSFAIEVAGRSDTVTHTHYASLRVKDAVVDRFRARTGGRPDVDTTSPDIRIHLHLRKDSATLSLDLAGDSLHRRGYRQDGVEAPLKENLAAALLLRAGWPALARSGAALLDPMCGSGTLVVEAALMAADIAPGLHRRFGFAAWSQHQPLLWKTLLDEAQARARAGRLQLPVLQGQDLAPGAIKAARANAERAGLSAHIQWTVADASHARPPSERGLLITNPPYGERLGDEAEIIKLYSLLGDGLKRHFGGWQAAVFTGRPDLAPRLGLRAESLHSFYNGALPCKLLRFEIAAATPTTAAAGGGQDFANRLDKNLRHLAKWAKRRGVANYRVYDGDLPDYAVAVDLYDGPERHVHVQEYAAPKTIDPVKAERRLREALAVIQQRFDIPASRLHFRVRRPQRGTAQYEKQNEAGRFHEVSEHGCRLLLNFDDYLDTGLFLDHRPLRLRIQKESSGKRFLNLFCYTASASAHAVLGGARRSASVDLSNTYLEWGERNLRLNGARPQFLDHADTGALPKHAMIRADARDWLRLRAQEKLLQFDLILLDPPTFSNSKRMDGTLDIQRDHAALIGDAAVLLAPGGTLYFSTNRRGFKLDAAVLEGALTGLKAQDITQQTLDEDFKRPPPAHRCWQITRS